MFMIMKNGAMEKMEWPGDGHTHHKLFSGRDVLYIQQILI